MGSKVRVATASLAGCFGCHMSLLDIDERILELAELVELDASPLTDTKKVGTCDLAMIEGGVANAENVKVLREFRARCRILIAVGACAIDGGVPAMRNRLNLRECLEEIYVDGVGVHNPGIPDDPEIPLLLNEVRPIHEVVKVDYFLPGCPPSADSIWEILTRLIKGGPVALPNGRIHYD